MNFCLVFDSCIAQTFLHKNVASFVCDRHAILSLKHLIWSYYHFAIISSLEYIHVQITITSISSLDYVHVQMTILFIHAYVVSASSIFSHISRGNRHV